MTRHFLRTARVRPLTLALLALFALAWTGIWLAQLTPFQLTLPQQIVDLLAQESDLVCRYQGGPNAGHTIVVDGGVTIRYVRPNDRHSSSNFA